MAKLKDRLKQMLDEKGIKAAQLARDTGITRGTISKYPSEDTKKYDARILIKMAYYLNVDANWLHGDTDERHPFEVPTIMEIFEQLSPTGKEEAIQYTNYLLEKERKARKGE